MAIKTPITIINWRGYVSDLKEAKNILKELSKEYSDLARKKDIELKKKPKKRDLNLYLSVPSSFIYPLQEFVKEKKNEKLKKIIIGAQNFEEIDKTNKNNCVTFSQIKSIGTKFVILNNDIEFENKVPAEIVEELPKEKSKKKNEIDNVFLQRLNSISKKNIQNKKEEVVEEKIDPEKESEEQRKLLLKAKEKEFQVLEEKLKTSLQNQMETVLIIKSNNDDLTFLTSFVKRMVKNLHYNFFDKLFICYETGKKILNMDRVYVDDCQEKVITIRRAIANLFGIDNAKRVRILYSGPINLNNVNSILKEGSVDGILINNETSSAKDLAKILVEATV
ncbi:hypothetical protein SDC9_21741 [bioreactor metagenome]|uniref:Uncharacterized protein n=1 Tax=bioreactor metagenome TaxID=1076179 RepID=A0A644UAK4_9ZZZZ|nr:triose-phosphate isomerase [Candidatus Elulimicrobiales bacterium]